MASRRVAGRPALGELPIATQVAQHVVDRLGQFGAVAPAHARVRAQPVRQHGVGGIGPLQHLAKHALDLVDTNDRNRGARPVGARRRAAIGALVGGQADPSFGQPARRRRIDLVFDLEHAPGQRLGRIARQHRHAALRDDGAVVEHGRHEMHRATMRAHAGGQGLRMRMRMRMQAGKRRQQRRMDIDQPARVVIDEARREHPHESGQQHVIGRVAVDLLGQRGVERLAAGVVLVVEGRGGDALLARPIQAGGVRAAGDHGGHFGRPGLPAARLHQGLHVAAAPGNQDDEAALGIGHLRQDENFPKAGQPKIVNSRS